MTERRALACAVALGAALRVFDLGGESFWGDELAMALVTGRGWDAVRDELLRGRAPVFLLLGHFWMLAFGTGEAAARSLSALAGIVSLPLLYLVGRRLTDGPTAVLGVLLMAVSGFQIAYAQEYRYYALLVLLALVSMLFYVRVVEAGRPGDVVGWALCSGALFHTHPYGLLVAAAQDVHFALWVSGRPRLRRSWVAAHALLAVLVLPGLVVRQMGTFTGAQRIPSWIAEPSAWQPLVTLSHFLFPRGTSPWLVAVAFGALLVAFVAQRARGTRLRLASRGHGALLALWLALPILVPLVASWLFTPIYVDRYVMAASPALYLAVALVLQAVRGAVPLPLSVCALLVAIAPGLHDYYATIQKEQWREAAARLRAQAGPGDVVVFLEPAPGLQARAFGWYHRGPARVCSIDRDRAGADARQLWSALLACVPPAGRVFAFERTSAAPQHSWVQQWIAGPDPRLRLRGEELFRGITLREVQPVSPGPAS